MQSLKSKKPVLVIIIIAICVAIYVVMFHVPRPVMIGEEMILSAGGGTYEAIDENDNVIDTFEYGEGQIFVKVERDNTYATIDADKLAEILKSTNCLMEVINPPFDGNEKIYDISLLTNNGMVNIFIGEENVFWYRSGDDTFKNRVIDGETFTQRITDALIFY